MYAKGGEIFFDIWQGIEDNLLESVVILLRLFRKGVV